MKKRILGVLLSAVIMSTGVQAMAEDLFNKTYEFENGATTMEIEVPDGDYSVNVVTGGETETKANIYINGGERVRAYTQEAGTERDNIQPVIPVDGKIAVEVLGEVPNAVRVEVSQIVNREEPNEKPTIYIAGDSTAQTYNAAKAYPQTGWGQVLPEYFTDDVVIDNRSMAGRSSKSYNNDGRFDSILTTIAPGDYVLIQFGINDGAVNKPERYIEPEAFKELYKEKFIAETVKRGATPILLTATPQGDFDENGKCIDSRQDYAPLVIEVAEETGTLVIDANRIIQNRLTELGPQVVSSYYFVCEPLESVAYPDGVDEHTHFKWAGANEVARLMAEALAENLPELAEYAYTSSNPKRFTDTKGHWGEDYINNLLDKNFVSGMGDGTFAPEKNVTRAEFLSMAMRAAGEAGHAYREGECLDATADSWYRFELQGAVDKGIIPPEMIDGYKNETIVIQAGGGTSEYEKIITTGSFKGNEPITREEMCAIAVKLVDMENADVVQLEADMDVNFTDSNEISDYAHEYVARAAASGLVSGMGDGTFAPKSEATRAQASVIITNMINLLQEEAK